MLADQTHTLAVRLLICHAPPPWLAAALPTGKPRYVMGIGYPLDVVVCTALGADMYDRCEGAQAW